MNTTWLITYKTQCIVTLYKWAMNIWQCLSVRDFLFQASHNTHNTCDWGHVQWNNASFFYVATIDLVFLCIFCRVNLTPMKIYTAGTIISRSLCNRVWKRNHVASTINFELMLLLHCSCWLMVCHGPPSVGQQCAVMCIVFWHHCKHVIMYYYVLLGMCGV